MILIHTNPLSSKQSSASLTLHHKTMEIEESIDEADSTLFYCVEVEQKKKKILWTEIPDEMVFH